MVIKVSESPTIATATRIIHFLLARKTNSILITRDKKLIEIAEEYSVVVKKPEEIL